MATGVIDDQHRQPWRRCTGTAHVSLYATATRTQHQSTCMLMPTGAVPATDRATEAKFELLDLVAGTRRGSGAGAWTRGLIEEAQVGSHCAVAIEHFTLICTANPL